MQHTPNLFHAAVNSGTNYVANVNFLT